MSGTQLTLAHIVDVTGEVDGIEMGVLRDGTAFLSGRGLAEMCGVAASTVNNQYTEWSRGRRSNALAKMLVAAGYKEPSLYKKVVHGGRVVYAFPEVVCMTFLEYFALESPTMSHIALANLRKTIRAGLRVFVYTQLGYAVTAPAPAPVPVDWQKFRDRLLLASAPSGYFGVFKEMADFTLAAIHQGLRVDEHCVPDISVGLAWGKHWTTNKLDAKYGERRKFEHFYPEYFPQAASNPQDVWVYPLQALGEFRLWLEGTYIPQRFPSYLEGKVKQGLVAPAAAQRLLAGAPPANTNRLRKKA